MTTGAKVDAADVAVLGVPITDARVDGADVSVLCAPTTGAKVDAVDVAIAAYMGPCATRRCQLWRITRRDGQVLRYTSLDVDFTGYGGTFKSCHSLSASASESSAELQSVGSVELTGILDDDGISEGDLYAGLYDDAYVEVWLVPYDGLDDAAPTRLAAGSTGKISRGEHSFTAEVLGPGARLQQAGLVKFFTPGCRFDFGDGDCAVDVESLKIATAPVTGSRLRTVIDFTASAPGGSTIWNGGKVRWLTGRNAGAICQVDTVDFGAQALSLWDVAPYAPAIGDTFDLLPGCTYDKPGCVAYSNLLRYGGFPDVPGPDAMQSNADSLFTGNG